MPVSVLSDFSSALSLIMRPQLTRQFNSVCVLPHLLPIVPGEGKSVNWTVQFTGAANAVASVEGVARSSADADDEAEVPATLPWSQYDKVSSVSDLAQAATGTNFNPESVSAIGRDLLLGKVVEQSFRMARGLAIDMYAGNETATPPQIAGAARMIDSSGIVAGINPATFTEWSSTETAASLAGVSFETITTFATDIYTASGKMPEFYTAPPPVWNKLKSLFTQFEANVRAVSEINLARGGGSVGNEARSVRLSAGMRAFDIEGIPVVLDRDCTASTLYAWNTEDVEIQQLDPLQSILEGGAAAINELFSRLAGTRVQLPTAQIEGMMARSAGLRPHVNMLGKRGMSQEAIVAVFAQVRYRRRNTFGKIGFSA